MKIIHDLWFNTIRGSAGIVVGEDENTGERKLYVGVGSGQSLERDQQEVVHWGTKLSLERLDEVRALLAPPGEKTTGKYAIQMDALQLGVLYGLILEAKEMGRRALKDVEKQLVAIKLKAEEAAGVTKEILPGGMLRLTEKDGTIIERPPFPYETEGN